MNNTKHQLGDPCKRALRLLSHEFQRCSASYPSLKYDKLHPHSCHGPTDISFDEWAAFRVAHGDVTDKDACWRWDGPHRGWDLKFPLYLGRWTGHLEGVDEFRELANTVCMVLDGDDYASLWMTRMGDYADWLELLHRWASLHRLPLLRSEVSIFGTSDYPGWDQFYEMAEQWVDKDGVRYPRHPLVWSLSFNVFTSSIAAIDAMLHPEDVIAYSEPFVWFGHEVDEVCQSDEFESENAADTPPCDRSENWIELGKFRTRIHFGPEANRGPQEFQASTYFERLATLLGHPYHMFSANELYRTVDIRDAERNCRKPDYYDFSDDVLDTPGIIDPREDRMDERYRNQLNSTLETLAVAKQQAAAAGNTTVIEHIQREARFIESQIKRDTDIRGHDRKMADDDYEKHRKAVSKSIRVVKKTIYDKLPLLAQHLKYIETRGGFGYFPPGDIMAWDVIRSR